MNDDRRFALSVAWIALALCHNAVLADPQLSPAVNASSICPDAPLVMTFLAPVALSGRGKITITDTSSNTVVDTIDTATNTAIQSIGGVPNFKYFPVTIAGGIATIHPKNGSRTYGKTYHVAVEEGVFKADTAAEKAAEWSFNTKAAEPAPGTAKLVIAADGSGDFSTLQGAMIPSLTTTPLRSLSSSRRALTPISSASPTNTTSPLPAKTAKKRSFNTPTITI